ncbi:unnamed protein product [Toxocara canis]|uniref:Uracil phosphoribosyltransferase n=1 Tax=Toxocara canis TaxID=6265 RepID=A0A183UDW3_TOXCA|nr:unnamed protein product [Toxocara canis]
MENGDVLPDNVYLLEPTDQEGLNRLPYTSVTVETPTRFPYEGIAFARGNCGVSISRSGEAMEHALRQCCRSIRIGKMLLADDTRLLYARLMPDIAQRRVLLLYPLLSSGRTVIKAVSVLVENNVLEGNILLLTLFSTPSSIKKIMSQFPAMSILTSDINACIPYHFATKYFGTD